MSVPRPAAPVHRAIAAAALLAAALPAAVGAQATPRDFDGVRVGASLGGTGLMGLTVEWVAGGKRSLEVTLATFAFHDVSLGVAGRQYFGGGYLKPVLGAGVWLSHGLSADDSGTALLARLPLGIDWRAFGEQFLDLTVSTNRLLWIRQGADDPDAIPHDGRLVPIPELGWRWRP